MRDRCDGGAKVGLPRPGPVEPLASSLSSSLKSRTRASSPTSSINDGLDGLADDRTAPNTPPTPQSHLPSPPLPAAEAGFANLGIDPIRAAARREQSDQASALIGQRLLQGWALLDAQCENETCFAVPLMRRPAFKPKVADAESAKNGSASVAAKVTDPRRYCVICHRDYLREGEIEEYERYVEATQGKAAAAQAVTAKQSGSSRPVAEDELVQHSAAAKKRRFATSAKVSRTGGMSASQQPAAQDPKGKQRAVDVSSSIRESTSITDLPVMIGICH